MVVASGIGHRASGIGHRSLAILSEDLQGAFSAAGRCGQAQRHGAGRAGLMVQNEHHSVPQTMIGDHAGDRSERWQQDRQGVRANVPQGPAITAPL